MTRRELPPRGRTHVMGVLNLTPDSFSDGGRFAQVDDAIAAGRALVEGGAAILDVGAVSTRPGAASVDAGREWARLEPVLGALREAVEVPLSLDTTSAVVLERACAVGVDLLNDVSALGADSALGEIAAAHELPVVLMHRRGTPRDMQDDPRFADAPAEVIAELLEAVARARAFGIPNDRLLLDPGIGFGKRLEDNLALLGALPQLVELGHRTVLGCSRKSFLGVLTGREVTDREHATTATTVLAAQAGVDFVRVHDAAAAHAALSVVEAVSVASKPLPG